MRQLLDSTATAARRLLGEGTLLVNISTFLEAAEKCSGWARLRSLGCTYQARDSLLRQDDWFCSHSVH